MKEFSECRQSWWYQVSSGSRWCCMRNPSHTRNTRKKKFCKFTKRLIVSQPPWTGECGPCPRPWYISSSSSSALSLSSATGGPPGTTRGLRISALETGPGSSRWWRRAGRSCSNVSRTWLMQDLKTVRKFVIALPLNVKLKPFKAGLTSLKKQRIVRKEPLKLSRPWCPDYHRLMMVIIKRCDN